MRSSAPASAAASWRSSCMRSGPSPVDILLVRPVGDLRAGRRLRRPARPAAAEHAGRQHERARDRSDPLPALAVGERSARASGGVDPAVRPCLRRARVYGRYLRDLLDRAEAAAPGDVALSRIGHRVVGLTEEQGGLRLTLADGSARAADLAVLCIGNLPPRLPPAPGVETVHRPAADRQSLGRGEPRPDRAGRRGAGAGQRPHDGRRRGPARRPRPSRPDPGALAPRTAAERACRRRAGRRPRNGSRARSPRACCSGTSAVRSRAPSALGIDWRAVLDAWRDQVPLLWQRLPMVERRRFLRHLRPYWDVHRHRMAPEIAAQIQAMQASGRLEVRAGTIEAYQAVTKGIAVRFRTRRQRRRDPDRRRLAGQLRRPDARLPAGRGAAGPGPSGAAGSRGRSRSGSASRPPAVCSCCGATGGRTRACSRSGRLTRGTFWETSAVPEIREQGRTLARAPGDERRRPRGLGRRALASEACAAVRRRRCRAAAGVRTATPASASASVVRSSSSAVS